MKIEADIAAFLGTTACIIYAQAFSTISSVIPAFSKRGDIIVADRAVNYSIKKGIQISRSTVRWFEHNDMEDLQRVLAKVTKEQSKKPLTRRFIITEGLFENVGDLVDLPKVIELKLKYKFRLILDETWSFGVLGRTGRGVTEHQHVDAAEVDMIVGSMAGPLCAAGGFCAGSDEIVEHQRLSAAAYTFSAALPAMSATTASETVLILQTQPELVTQLRDNIKTMWTQLDPRSDWVSCTSAPENPIMLLVLKADVVSSRRLSLEDQMQLMQDIVDEVSPLHLHVGRFADTFADTCARGHDHPRKGPPSGCWWHEERGLRATAGAQGVLDDRLVAEGDREGWYHDSACYHQGHDKKEVMLTAWNAAAGGEFHSSILIICHIQGLHCRLGLFIGIVIHYTSRSSPDYEVHSKVEAFSTRSLSSLLLVARGFFVWLVPSH